MKTIPAFDIQADYDRIHRTFPGYKTAPVIGLTGNFQDGNCMLAEGYYQSILKAGGTPFIIPCYDDTDALINTLEKLDGILLTGGADINPLFLGEEPVKELHGINPRRDRQELLLTRLAADRQIPILGICRGIQTMNAAFGGPLYQDIHSQMEGTRIKHSQELDRSYASHTVTIEKDTLLHNLFKADTIAVNSFHHQAVKEAAPGFRVCARATDGGRVRVRAAREGATVILSSATPSILSFAMARRGDYTLVEMPHRVQNRPLPEVTIVDMRKELDSGNRSIFSRLLIQKLTDCLESGQQAMLFINRRGYAQFVNCRSCGKPVRCSNCDVSLTYHRDGSMKCHYCGHEQKNVLECPECKSNNIRSFQYRTWPNAEKAFEAVLLLLGCKHAVCRVEEVNVTVLGLDLDLLALIIRPGFDSQLFSYPVHS